MHGQDTARCVSVAFRRVVTTSPMLQGLRQRLYVPLLDSPALLERVDLILSETVSRRLPSKVFAFLQMSMTFKTFSWK